MRSSIILPKVYIASKLSNIEEVKSRIKNNSKDTEFVSTWHMFTEVDTSSAKNDMKHLWNRCFREIDSCDYIWVILKKDDMPKGCMIEIGYGLAKDKKIYIPSSHNFTRTIEHHSRVQNYSSFRDIHIDFEKTIK